MSEVNIQEPRMGNVTLELSWNDAEILLRALGRVNAGNLSGVSSDLYNVVDELVTFFGRDHSSEANKYVSEVRNGQVLIHEV